MGPSVRLSLGKERSNGQQLTRQRRWQVTRVAEGRCSLCGKPRRHYAAVCDNCALAKRRRIRALQGFSPWKPGGRGRPPLLADALTKHSRQRAHTGKTVQQTRSRRPAPSRSSANRPDRSKRS